MMCKQRTAAFIVAAVLGTAAVLVAQQPPAPAAGASQQDAVAALKKSIEQGQKLIRNYEWVETTIISLKGEEKARKQNRCYYGADGKVQKVPIGAPAAAKQGGGGRRGGKMKQQIVEKKKDEMQDYMERAAALIHQYVPPNPAQIQAAKEAGRVTVTPPAQGSVHVQIAQYLLAGDSLAIDLDAAANRLTALAVNTYLGTPEDPVTLAVQMAALPDGATYAAQTTLDAKAKNIRVVIQNSGHRPVAR
jgi:hypothetical protein